jgi:hypothetical protein
LLNPKKYGEQEFIKNVNENDLDKKRKENYPEMLLGHIEKSAKTTLESSLKFNQSLFESSVAYYKKQLS